MPEMIELFRKAAAQNTARKVGLRAGRPNDTVLRQKAAFNESDILALPQDFSNYQPLQDLDPESDTFGAFYFMVNYDPIGGSNPIR